MYIDVVKLLQQIPESSWNLGNESRYTFKDGYFIKCLVNKAPDKVHNFFTTNKLNNTLGAFIPKFEMYYYLTDTDVKVLNNVVQNASTHRHIYVFDKVSFLDLRLFYNKRESKDVMPILDELQVFFGELDKENVAYQDACWENIGCNKITGKLCVIDVDSMVDINETYEKIKNFGSPLFHTSFLQFKRKYPHSLQNIKWLNLTTFHNMLFAFVIGLAIDDTEFTFMKKKSAVNSVVTNYINGDYTNKVDMGSYKLTLDDESVKVLKSATKTVEMCIENRYIGLDPYADMAELVKELISKFPAVRVPQKIPAAASIPSSSAYSSASASGYSGADIWSKHLPSARTASHNPYTGRTPTPTTSTYTAPPPLPRLSKNRGPNVLLTLAHAMTVLTIIMMLVNVFMPHGAVIAANNTSNATNNNSTVIVPVINGSAVNVTNTTGTTVNVTDMNSTNVQALNMSVPVVINYAVNGSIPDVVNVNNSTFVKVNVANEDLLPTNNSLH
jgi:hypothetical protein